MRKVELLPTRDCEAGYSPDIDLMLSELLGPFWTFENFDQKFSNF